MDKYLIDSNLPEKFRLWKGEEFVRQSDRDIHAEDSRIWDYAIEHNLTIITKDADFYNRALNQPLGPKVVHIHLNNLSMDELYTCLVGLWPSIVRLLETNRSLEVYSDLKAVQIRILPL